jgi:uncharacterized protein YpbB
VQVGIILQAESQRLSLSSVNKHNTQQNGEAYSPVLANQNTDRFVKMTQQKQKNKSVINKEEKSPVGGSQSPGSQNLS